MSDILTVEFNSLPESVRNRFVAITKGAAGPAPLVAQKTSSKSKVVGLIVLLVLLFLVTAVVMIVGFGDPWNGLNIHDPIYVGVFWVPLVFALLFVLLTIVMRLTMRSPYPFDPGRYLFPSDFVDARGKTLRIVPMRLLTDFKGVHMHTNGRYTHTLLTFTFQGATEQFSVFGQEQAQATTNAFWESQRMMQAAVQAQDWQAVANLDPFFECRRTNFWGQPGAPAVSGPAVKTASAFFRWRAAVAGLVAVMLCPMLALGRNLASDEAAFSRAKEADTEYSYRAYVENGWRHVEEARLAQPIAAFREAKKKGTVSEMRRILKDYPGSSVEGEARAALHELYVSTLEDFRAKASTADARLLPFMERLIDYMERNDTSTVRVVFSQPGAVALSQADEELERRYAEPGKIFEPISPYFDTTRSAAREDMIVSRLNTAFATIFPTDLLRFETGAQEASASKDPSISIAYVVGPSGGVYESNDGERIFVGIDVGFTMLMTIPSDTRSFDFKLKVSPPDRFGYNYSPGENQAEAAYNAMAQRAFDEFTTKLQAVFFKS